MHHVIVVKKGVDKMSISDKNTRTNITIPKELKAKLEDIAKKENRSFNNLVITVLSKFAEDSE